MKVWIAVAAVGCAFLSGCSSDTSVESKSEHYHHDLTVNGCRLVYDANSLNDFCSQLQDDARDTCGVASFRNQIFMNNSCGTTFVRTNSRVATRDTQQPVGRSTTAPAPVPAPVRPTPLNELQTEFAAIGIKVEIDRTGTPIYRPGQPPFAQELARAIPILSGMKAEFARRAADIQSIEIGHYTAYHAGHLTIGASRIVSDLGEYLSFFDRQVALARQSNITIDFGIVDFDYDNGARYAIAKRQLQFFSSGNASSSLRQIGSLIDTIDLTTSNYLKMFNKTWELDANDFESQFRADIGLLKKMAALRSRGIEFDSYLNLKEPHAALEGLVDILASRASDLAMIAAIEGATKITVEIDSDSDASYIGTDVKLHVKNKMPNLAGLFGLADIAPLLVKQKLQFEMSGYALDDDFAAQAKSVKARSAAIAAKPLITKIYFGGSSSDFSYGTLYVGTDGLAGLDKALAKAH